MHSLRILYIRDDDSFDEILKKVIKLSGYNWMLDIRDINEIEYSQICCQIDLQCNFDIVLVLNKNSREIKKFVQELPAPCVIELCDKESFEDICQKIDGKFIEQFLLEYLEKDPHRFITLVKKNSLFLDKCYEYRNLMKAIFQIIPNGFSLFDLNGTIIYTNARITGYEPEELLGKTIFDFLKKEDQPIIQKLIEQYLSTKKLEGYEVNVLSKYGALIPVKIKARVLTDKDDKPLYILAVLTDIREKKDFWEKEQFLGNVIRGSRDGIMVADREGRITLWNKGDEEIFKYSASEMLGQKISVLSPSKEEELQQKIILKTVMEKGYLKGLSSKRRRKDGKVIDVEINLTALYDEEGRYKGVMGIIRDISSTKKALEEVRKKNEEMEHLINTVSHDIRSPLHSIDNYLKFISESIKDKVTDEDVYEMLQRTHANVSNIESLLQDLTDFSRAGLITGEEVAVDLNSLTNDIIINLQWQVGRKNFIITRDQLPTIRIDPRRIYQVLENLLSNAYKFKKEDEPAKAEIRVKFNDNEIEFIVNDEGIGIDKKHHSRIFDLFYRGKQKIVKGSGAGLAITRRIIHTYGGRIWFETQQKGGSSFHFTLPSSLVVVEEN